MRRGYLSEPVMTRAARYVPRWRAWLSQFGEIIQIIIYIIVGTAMATALEMFFSSF